jgi:hypothetical protein
MNTRKARKNKWLTQAELNEGEERIFVKELSGFGNLDELFTEWSNTQKNKWQENNNIE